MGKLAARSRVSPPRKLFPFAPRPLVQSAVVRLFLFGPVGGLDQADGLVDQPAHAGQHDECEADAQNDFHPLVGAHEAQREEKQPKAVNSSTPATSFSRPRRSKQNCLKTGKFLKSVFAYLIQITIFKKTKLG